MKYELIGGPCPGPLETDVQPQVLPLRTIEITHINCVCNWCKDMKFMHNVHLYRVQADGTFIYRESQHVVLDNSKSIRFLTD